MNMQEAEQLSKPTPVHVHLYSWWKTPDNEQLLVVVRIWNGDNQTPTCFEVLDVAETAAQEVNPEVFRNQVRAGRLVQVVRKADIPRPPSLF